MRAAHRTGFPARSAAFVIVRACPRGGGRVWLQHHRTSESDSGERRLRSLRRERCTATASVTSAVPSPIPTATDGGVRRRLRRCATRLETAQPAPEVPEAAPPTGGLRLRQAPVECTDVCEAECHGASGPRC